MSSATTTQPQNQSDKLKSAGNQAGQTARDAGQTAGQKAEDLAHAAGQKAADLANAAGQKASDLAHTAGQKASDLTHAAGQKVQDAARTVGHKAEDATSAVGSSFQTAADKVREKLPHEGMLGKASEAVADALDRSGHYIQEKNIRGMADDVTEVIKRNPIPAVFIAVGLGYLLGRTLRS
jgi:ElaB/YqjD/DUF883 family membrane-anchored ribosome-binding protein